MRMQTQNLLLLVPVGSGVHVCLMLRLVDNITVGLVDFGDFED